jgi:hypothetical protein
MTLVTSNWHIVKIAVCQEKESDVETAQGFFGRELDKIDLTIRQMQDTIAADPSANGRCAGMRAMLRVQQHHRLILDNLAAEAHNLTDALAICHQLLIITGREHARLTELGGLCNPRWADAWWDTRTEIQYLVNLSRRLQDAIAEEAGKPGYVNGRGSAR